MRKRNQILLLSIMLGTLYFTIFHYDSQRILTYLAVIPVLIAPYILRKTKYQLDDSELFYYYLFIFFADFLGCVANLYNIVWWYDIFIHFCSGIFTFAIGLFLLKKWQQLQRNLMTITFCLGITMLVASGWEFFEFLTDNLLGMNLQHNIDTGVIDTMQDMIAAFLGGILASFIYIKVKDKKSIQK